MNQVPVPKATEYGIRPYTAPATGGSMYENVRAAQQADIAKQTNLIQNMSGGRTRRKRNKSSRRSKSRSSQKQCYLCPQCKKTLSRRRRRDAQRRKERRFLSDWKGGTAADKIALNPVPVPYRVPPGAEDPAAISARGQVIAASAKMDSMYDNQWK